MSTVTTWYLQFQGPKQAQPQWPAGVTLQEAEIASPELSQFLFTAVGLPWRWFSRLSWTYQDWLDYLTKEQVRTFVLYQRGTPAGFAELWRHPAPDQPKADSTAGSDSVELKFFGLLPAFTGQGLGQLLAQAAVAHAQHWCDGPVWLHTCSDDHPAALATYQKAGFVITETTQEPSAAVLDYPQAALAQPFVLSRLARYTP